MNPWVYMSLIASSGASVIEEWLLDLEKRRDRKRKVRNKFHTYLRHLRFLPVPWPEQYYTHLGDGVGEFRPSVNKVEYRVFAFFGPGPSQVTLLLGGFHKGDHYNPLDSIERAKELRHLVIAGERRIRNYEWLG